MKTYEELLPRHERVAFEEVLGMEQGYLLDFSDRTFGDFFTGTIGIDPDSVEGSKLFSGRGTSKAKRFRSFVERVQPGLAAKAFRHLWDYRESNRYTTATDRDAKLKEIFFKVVSRFEGVDTSIDASEIVAFEPSETLEELVASIRRDLEAKRPHAALDRLHTYCMKRFASLVAKHGGGDCGENDPLHSRVARYVKALKAEKNLTEMSERIVKNSISTFESMNQIRNNQSFAHDKEALVSMEEARFIFDSVTALLRFIRVRTH